MCGDRPHPAARRRPARPNPPHARPGHSADKICAVAEAVPGWRRPRWAVLYQPRGWAGRPPAGTRAGLERGSSGYLASSFSQIGWARSGASCVTLGAQKPSSPSSAAQRSPAARSGLQFTRGFERAPPRTAARRPLRTAACVPSKGKLQGCVVGQLAAHCSRPSLAPDPGFMDYKLRLHDNGLRTGMRNHGCTETHGEMYCTFVWF